MKGSLPNLGTAVHEVRRWLHVRYVRAIVTGLYAALSLCSVAAIALEVRHDVSLRAIVGFFGRGHLQDEDLGPWIGHHETARQLDSLALSDSRMNPGGLVYAEGGALRFYPHATREAVASRDEQTENLELFPRLVGLYHGGELEPLLALLDSEPAASRLRRRGLHPDEIAGMRRRLDEPGLEEAERTALLRKTAVHIGEFVPYVREPYDLPFGEELRFYDSQRPAGDFVGVFEVHGLAFAAIVDEAYAESVSRYSHYIAIFPRIDGTVVLRDYYRGERREYRVLPVSHPGGLQLRKVSEIT